MDMLEGLAQQYESMFGELTEMAERIDALDSRAIHSEDLLKTFMLHVLRSNAQLANGLSILADAMRYHGMTVPMPTYNPERGL